MEEEARRPAVLLALFPKKLGRDACLHLEERLLLLALRWRLVVVSVGWVGRSLLLLLLLRPLRLLLLLLLLLLLPWALLLAQPLLARRRLVIAKIDDCVALPASLCCLHDPHGFAQHGGARFRVHQLCDPLVDRILGPFRIRRLLLARRTTGEARCLLIRAPHHLCVEG